MRARGMGAQVIVVEADWRENPEWEAPIRALRAVMEGFKVMPMSEAAKIGDIFVTVTGDVNVIRREHLEVMKDGAILANAGHFNVEISIPDLEELSVRKRVIKGTEEEPIVTEYELKNGKRLYLLTAGRLVNLIAAEGHPSEVMDMSFSNQALSVQYIIRHGKELKPRVYKVPRDIDNTVARLKLETMGIYLEELTEEQKEYLLGWERGTI